MYSDKEAGPRSPVTKSHVLGEVELGETDEVLYINGEVFSLAQEWLPENQARSACPGGPAPVPSVHPPGLCQGRGLPAPWVPWSLCQRPLI